MTLVLVTRTINTKLMPVLAASYLKSWMTMWINYNETVVSENLVLNNPSENLPENNWHPQTTTKRGNNQDKCLTWSRAHLHTHCSRRRCLHPEQQTSPPCWSPLAGNHQQYRAMLDCADMRIWWRGIIMSENPFVAHHFWHCHPEKGKTLDWLKNSPKIWNKNDC